jgi:hypothetical protein
MSRKRLLQCQILKMHTVGYSETSVTIYQSTWINISEDLDLEHPLSTSNFMSLKMRKTQQILRMDSESAVCNS